MNKIIVSGRMTRNPEVRTTPSGKTVASFVVATDRNYLNAEGKRDADFIPVVIWGKAATYVGDKGAKGGRVLVEGRLQIRNFDAKDGTKHWVTEIVANSVELLDTKKTSTNQEPEASDEMPFDIPDIPDDTQMGEEPMETPTE